MTTIIHGDEPISQDVITSVEASLKTFIEEAAKTCNIPEARIGRLIANVMNYAYPLPPTGVVSTELETIVEGFDAKITQFGQLQLQMNTPTGRAEQLITLHPVVALLLRLWLDKQDWNRIRGLAEAGDAELKIEFASLPI
jgi:hypothetical protein